MFRITASQARNGPLGSNDFEGSKKADHGTPQRCRPFARSGYDESVAMKLSIAMNFTGGRLICTGRPGIAFCFAIAS